MLEAALGSGELAPGDASAAANALGRSYVAQARFDEAFALFERFLDEARSRGDQFEELRFALLLANALIDNGDFGRAHEMLGQVLDLAATPPTRCSARASTGPVARPPCPRRAGSRCGVRTDDNRDPEGERADPRRRRGVTAARLHRERPRQSGGRARARRGGRADRRCRRPGDGRSDVRRRASARPLRARRGRQAAALLLGIVPRLNAAAPKDAARAYLAVADIFREQGDTARALELYQLAVEQAPVPGRSVAAALRPWPRSTRNRASRRWRSTSSSGHSPRVAVLLPDAWSRKRLLFTIYYVCASALIVAGSILWATGHGTGDPYLTVGIALAILPPP